VVRASGGWESTGQPWVFDRAKYATLRAARDVEAELMRSYARKQRCLMLLLQEALDDPDPAPCGRCGVCTGEPVLAATADAAAVEQVRDWMRDQPVRLEPRKMWPSGINGRRGRIAGCDEGRAIAFADDPAWPDVIAEVSAGRAGEASAAAALRVLGAWRSEWATRPTIVVPLPGPDGGAYAAGLAAAIGEAGKLPVADVLRWSGSAVVLDGSSGARVRALSDRLGLAAGADIEGAVLLVAAQARTGWTTTLAAALLREAGASRVLPLVAHQHP
jgi:ATP-dependent DNA helicase RecQ